MSSRGRIVRILRRALAMVLALFTAILQFPTPAAADGTYEIIGLADMSNLPPNITPDSEGVYITDLSDYEISVRASELITDTGKGFTLPEERIALPKDRLPEAGKTLTLTDPFSVTFKNCGYTTLGTPVNATITVTSLQLYRPATCPLDERYDYVELARVNAESFGFYCFWNSIHSERYGHTPDRGNMGMHAYYAIKITDTDGNAIPGMSYAWRIKDIDECDRTYDVNDVPRYSEEAYSGPYAEAHRFVTGFDSRVYVDRNSVLTADTGNSCFRSAWSEGFVGTVDQEDPITQCTAYQTSAEATAEWWGSACGTNLFTVSTNTTYPALSDPVKTVEEGKCAVGDTLHYTVHEDFVYVIDANAPYSVAVTDVLDPALVPDRDLCSVTDAEGKDVTGDFMVRISGQEVTFQAVRPAEIVGGFDFHIGARVKNGALDGHRFVEEDGVSYAVLPNTASLVVVDNDGDRIEKRTGEVTTLVPGSSLSLVKSVDHERLANAAAGDVLHYSFVVTNTGEMTISGIALEDSLPVEDISWDFSKASAEGILAPGEKASAEAVYHLTQADLDAGEVHNEAAVSGVDPGGITVYASDTADTSLTGSADLLLTKTARVHEMTDARPGDEIVYDFTITNPGAVTLYDLAFTDDLAVTMPDWSASLTSLAPGGSLKGSAAYILTEEDLLKDELTNTAHVKAFTPDGTEVSDDASDTTTFAKTPSIALEKRTDVQLLATARAGDAVPYVFVITNDGSAPLTSVALTDSLPYAEGVRYDWSGAVREGVLGVGETITGSALYHLTQADIDSHLVKNEATVSGTAPDGQVVTARDTAILLIAEDPDVEMQKLVDETSLTDAAAGDALTYTLIAKNTGNVVLRDVSFTDELRGLEDLSYDWSDASEEGSLLPGESVKARAVYQLTQEDIDRGSVENTAFVTGTSPAGTKVRSDGSAETELLGLPAISLVKEADLTHPEHVKAGDVVSFTMTAANTGCTTLTDIAIEDFAETASEVVWDQGAAPETLLPKESAVARVTCTLTQADIDSGCFVNTARVTGRSPEGLEVFAEDDAEVELPKTAGITLEKEAEYDASKEPVEGDPISYRFVIANTGNVRLSDVQLLDELEGLADLVIDWSTAAEGAGVLLPGESVRGTASYALTQADIDRGELVNRASVTGTEPEGTKLIDDAETKTDLTRRAGLTVRKDVSSTLLRDAVEGDTLRYTMQIRNAGNVTLTEVTLEDALAGIRELAIDWSTAKESGVLAPGEMVLAEGLYDLTQADIDAGELVNTARVSGKVPEGCPAGDTDEGNDGVITAEDSVKTTLTGNPRVVLSKAVDKTTIANAGVGDVLKYVFVISNSGNVTVSEIELKDSMGSSLMGLKLEWPGESGVLKPGDSVTGTASYAVTQADLDAGNVENTAYVTGQTPDGGKLTGEKTTAGTTLIPVQTPSRQSSSGTNTTSGGTTVRSNSAPSQTVRSTSGTSGNTGISAGGKVAPVRTGDQSPVGLLLGLVFISLIAAAGVGVRMVRRRKQ